MRYVISAVYYYVTEWMEKLVSITKIKNLGHRILMKEEEGPNKPKTSIQSMSSIAKITKVRGKLGKHIA